MQVFSRWLGFWPSLPVVRKTRFIFVTPKRERRFSAVPTQSLPLMLRLWLPNVSEAALWIISVRDSNE